MKLAPIALFTYNRPWHTRQTVEALMKNDLATDCELIVFSDGPKNHHDVKKVDEVRQYINAIYGFQNVTLIERSENMGLGNSIISGVSEVLAERERVIVLEDDLVTSPFFLRYMNDALELYAGEEEVASVHGYIYPVAEKLPDTFFLRTGDCLGWATWKRAWDLFEEDGRTLLAELKRRRLTREFDFDGAFRFTRMLKNQIAGISQSWAVRWSASIFLNNRLTLYPGVSLVNHIGNDGAGTNFGASTMLDVELTHEPVTVGGIEIAETREARRIVGDYLRIVKTPILVAAFKAATKRIRQKMGF